MDNNILSTSAIQQAAEDYRLSATFVNKRGFLFCIVRYRNKENKICQKWYKIGPYSKSLEKSAVRSTPTYIEDCAEFLLKEMNALTPFYDFAMQWLKTKENDIRRSTFESYEDACECMKGYIETHNWCVETLSSKDIRQFLENDRVNRRDKPLTVNTLKHKLCILNQILDYAVELELIRENPAKNVKLPKLGKDERFKGQFLSVEEANQMLTELKGTEIYPVIYLTLMYGLRRSEVLGLRWESIDFEKGSMMICHTVVRHKTVIREDNTKNKSSRRTFFLFPEAREILQEVKTEQEKNRGLFGNTYIQSDYVFTQKDGKPYTPDHLVRMYQNAQETHNIRRIRFHDLRHSTASILYDAGMGLKDIQEWLGHSDIETTGNIYTHIARERQKLVMDKVETLFKSKEVE